MTCATAGNLIAGDSPPATSPPANLTAGDLTAGNVITVLAHIFGHYVERAAL